MALEIDLFQRRGTRPSRVGKAKPGLDLIDTTLSQIGEATAKFAGPIFDSLVKTKAANEIAAFKGGVNTSMAQFDVFTAAHPGASFEELEKERDRMITSIEKSAQKATAKIAKQHNQNWMLREVLLPDGTTSTNKGRLYAQTQASMEAIRTKQERNTFEEQRENMITNFDRKGLAELTTNMVESDMLEDNFAAAQLKNDFAIIDEAEKKAAEKAAREIVTKGFQTVIDNGGTREDGYAVVRAAEKEGLIPATLRGTLENNVDSFIAHKEKQGKDAVKLTTIETYTELSKPILTGDLKYEDVENSKLLKDDKARWLGDDTHKGYIKGSYEDAPTENTPEGHTVSFNATFDVATLAISPKDGYDILLEARFNDRSITDEQFKWAVNKLENPYPQPLLNDVQTTFVSNLEDFNRLFSFDNERNEQVNEQLIAWVDEQVAQGKTPTKKEMYAQSSQFRVGNDRWYDVGQIIERGGVTWEVVGFDENGEPLVEEAR